MTCGIMVASTPTWYIHVHEAPDTNQKEIAHRLKRNKNVVIAEPKGNPLLNDVSFERRASKFPENKWLC